MARGEENDSARSTKGSEPTVTDSRSCASSGEERARSAGYRTIWTSKPCGSAWTNGANKSPVPSMPGKRTSLGIPEDIEVIVASVPLDGNPAARLWVPDVWSPIRKPHHSPSQTPGTRPPTNPPFVATLTPNPCSFHLHQPRIERRPAPISVSRWLVSAGCRVPQGLDSETWKDRRWKLSL